MDARDDDADGLHRREEQPDHEEDEADEHERRDDERIRAPVCQHRRRGELGPALRKVGDAAWEVRHAVKVGRLVLAGRDVVQRVAMRVAACRGPICGACGASFRGEPI